ncbi:MAG: amylo-alpha-1,6-glucosidase, partial [Planctomycetota bacterium]
MVPVPAWRRIIQQVRSLFPDTLFHLEGLGGGWQDTANLLQGGGMHWAYSELFQNYAPHEVGPYLDHCIQASQQVGLLVHYSETHDNQRLAARFTDRQQARMWSLLRNRLCALTAVAGGFGFTAGVEWLADEQLNVHNSRGLNWGAENDIVAELRQLTELLTEHPCFAEDAQLRRLSMVDHVVYALLRQGRDGSSIVVLANLDGEHPHSWPLPSAYSSCTFDLVTGQRHQPQNNKKDQLTLHLQPGQVLCLSTGPWENTGAGSARRLHQRQAAYAMQALAEHIYLADFGPADPLHIAERFANNPAGFLTALRHVDGALARKDLLAALDQAMAGDHYPALTRWQVSDQPRITLVPCHHWLLVCHPHSFRCSLSHQQGEFHRESVLLADGQHYVCIPPQPRSEGLLELHCHDGHCQHRGQLRFSGGDNWPGRLRPVDAMTLLSNGRGGMARLAVDFGHISSKYDAALAANLHPGHPVDRHVFIKRLRLWAEVDGFISPLNGSSLREFSNDHRSSHWHFRAGGGGGSWLDIHLQAWMPPGSNSLCLKLWRGNGHRESDCRLVLRPDLEDRSFHGETLRNAGTEAHFRKHISHNAQGCLFHPAADRQLRLHADAVEWLAEEEWSHCQHSVEASRGQHDAGDAWSPGYWSISLDAASPPVHLCASAELPSDAPPAMPAAPRLAQQSLGLEERLRHALNAYLVRRDDGKTVIAGYPWFLDWGRDTLICARGYLAAGHHDSVRELLQVFGRFEEQGTLPNIIHGNQVGNRDTVDAPLWYGIVAEELATVLGDGIYDDDLGHGRSLAEVLRSIAVGYLDGTAGGISVDPSSALVWSPSHFTWMDTNYPAGTPRRGYPLEIQALWVRLLRHLARLDLPASRHGPWGELADRAAAQLDHLFWLPEQGWWADCLIAEKGLAAGKAVRDTALRSNVTIPIALSVLGGAHARSTLSACAEYLVVPGALRSLAPLRVQPGIPVRSASGELLNDPQFPYQGRYQGDEDRERKPAYHNGTAWTWPFPGFCEALVTTWPDDPHALAAAWAYLSSIDELLERGCLGHLPEIVDGNAPHQQRGCDAQAWGVTEALRVYLRLQNHKPSTTSAS